MVALFLLVKNQAKLSQVTQNVETSDGLPMAGNDIPHNTAVSPDEAFQHVVDDWSG